MAIDKIKAPKVISLDIKKLSANHVILEWDDVGSNFYYFIEIAEFKNNEDVIWKNLGYINDNKFYIETVKPNRVYQARVSVASEGFNQSDWTYSEKFKTFEKNLYNFSKMYEMNFAEQFLNEKFVRNNRGYIDFNNDVILASLMEDDFQFSPKMGHISLVSDKIIKKNEYHELNGNVSEICKDINRVMLGYIDDIYYVFERFQTVARVSNDKGQTWKLVDLVEGRVGDPISDTAMYQNETTSYILGTHHIFNGRPSSNIRWSSITERFSSTDISFTRMDNQLKLGFEIEVFNKYVKIPTEYEYIVEAMASSNNYVYIGAKNTMRYVDINDSKIDKDPNSPTFNQRLFNDEEFKITDNDLIVIKKMDVVNEQLLVLVTGELKDEFSNPRNPENVIKSDDSGVYLFEDGKFVRVFGNTEGERYFIEHEYTDMSTNGREAYISYGNYVHNEIKEYVVNPDNNEDDISMAWKIMESNGFLSDSKYTKGSFRADKNDLKTWNMGYMKYYNEPYFSYMARSGDRVWLANNKKFGVVNSEKEFTKIIETEGPTSETRILGERWINGDVYIDSPNVEFDDFKTYTSGVMFYKNSGEIVGFYEFPYKVRENVNVIWKPKHLMLYGSLVGQVRDEMETIDELKRLNDPNLVPFINKMIPENYIQSEDSRYRTFIKNYLEYISDHRFSSYKGLVNLIRNKDPLEQDSVDFLWSEMFKRNIYLDKKKKEETIRFFLSRKYDFYSAKGTIASYKFLFRLLYNEDVEIEDDYTGLEYYITVKSDNINENIVGKNIYTKTGRCYVTNIDRTYDENGNLVWQLSIDGLMGSFQEGQIIKDEDSYFEGIIETNIKGKEVLHDDIDYINKGKSYYIMKIKSNVPVSRYKDDIQRFVHPIGVGFKGIVMLTMFINTGLHMKHVETEINKYYTYKFDSGYPKYWADRVLRLDENDDPVIDIQTGELIYDPHPNAGKEFEIDVEGYNKENGFSGTSKPNIKYDSLEEYIKNVSPSDRRKRTSPLFDASGNTFSKFRDMTEYFIETGEIYRYKDNVGYPRDPVNPTQRKLTGEIKTNE